MMSTEQMRELNPGDRVSWGPQFPCEGWVILTNHAGMLVGWDGGELTVWQWENLPLMQRIGAHLSLVRKGQDL